MEARGGIGLGKGAAGGGGGGIPTAGGLSHQSRPPPRQQAAAGHHRAPLNRGQSSMPYKLPLMVTFYETYVSHQ